MPAAAWAARSGDPVLFAGARASCRRRPPRALRSHPKVPAYVLGPSSAISSDVLREVAAIAPRVRRVAGEDPVANAIALARYDDGGFGWNVNDPGHGFVVARSDEPLDAAAAAPLSASGTWGPLLLTDDADTLPAALRGYLLDVKPGYTDDPTRAFYNHVWVIGDQEAIEVGQQAEIDSLAELAKIGGEAMSEAENPELLGRAAAEVTAEDIRALAGASTPHFALQVRNRIRRLIEPLPAGHPARVEGERKIAELEELAEHSGDPRGTMGIGRALKSLAPGVWRLKEFPSPTINIYLAEDVLIDAGRRWDRRRVFAELEGREISLLALTHVHPDHQGVAKDVCEARGVPLACHADDVDAMEGRRPVQEAAPDHPVNRVIEGIWQGPPHKVGRVLQRGRRGRRLPRRPRPRATPAAR